MGAAAPAVHKIYFHSGTGFFVDRDGYLLTNEHVLQDCRRITISGAVPLQDVTLVATNKQYDLALLKTKNRVPDVAELRGARERPIQKNDRVVIIGYPGNAAKTGKTVMREGIVQSTSGLPDKPYWLQLSDIVEQGNSGGPLMDNTGNVVGVVVAKVELQPYVNGRPDPSRAKKSSAAITLAPVREFLNANGVSYRESPSGVRLSDSQVEHLARRFVVNVQCQYVPKRK